MGVISLLQVEYVSPLSKNKTKQKVWLQGLNFPNVWQVYWAKNWCWEVSAALGTSQAQGREDYKTKL